MRFNCWTILGAACLILAGSASLQAAGTLKPQNSTDQAIRITSHQVNITINNGFAQTEVLQTFYNPNEKDLEAVYSCPLPPKASLSEMTIWSGERQMDGEVLTKEEADKLYESEKAQGNSAGKAQKNSIQTFEFFVYPVSAQAETRVRYVYYQPIEIDTGVGRYVYPLESGGTDDLAKSFWTQNEKIDGEFLINLSLKSAYAVVDVRAPGTEAISAIEKKDDGHYTLKLKTSDGVLNKDFVFYYRLADNLPGRVEVIPYRKPGDQPGTFMMVMTPGIDLKPLSQGADYIYVLDTSGSMSGGKIQTLAKGVSKAIGGMRPDDRYRVIAFNTSAHEITRSWMPATPENIKQSLEDVSALQANGGTNIHDALREALKKLDADRATSIVLVTDGVTNTGVIDPKSFRKLLAKYDVRVFGFVMGNSANWPLMNLISQTTGGFSTGVSNDDDIVGQIMLAKSKITHETLRNARVEISGVKVHDTTELDIGKVYRGQQLVLFGRYEKGGDAEVVLKARLTGEEKEYKTRFTFPEVDEANPELERLWALNCIERADRQAMLGMLPPSELKSIQQSFGVDYQLVTDETTMLVLPDEKFAELGISRVNQARAQLEHAAQHVRSAQPAANYTVPTSTRTFPSMAPTLSGGGALNPVWLILMALGLGLGTTRFNRT
jgi:Ca-activated chloride channel family protein